MNPLALYGLAVMGAVALALLMRAREVAPRRKTAFQAGGAIVGLAAFGGLLAVLTEVIRSALGESAGPAGDDPEPIFHVLFSIIALASAVQMITTPRQVYAALHFVLVVLASAGLFLMLEAEFMAFALIIVYAGAILITYMFVLMLAEQAPDASGRGGAAYDQRPREPRGGAVVGFLLIALLTRVLAEGIPDAASGNAGPAAMRRAWDDLQAMPKKLDEVALAAWDTQSPDHPERDVNEPTRLSVSDDASRATATFRTADGQSVTVELDATALPDNTQSVGLGLLTDFPISLELAGVILTMAMFGAVILARRQIELTDDEKRQAAGMARLGHHDEPGPHPGGNTAGAGSSAGAGGGAAPAGAGVSGGGR